MKRYIKIFLFIFAVFLAMAFTVVGTGSPLIIALITHNYDWLCGFVVTIPMMIVCIIFWIEAFDKILD